MASDLFFLYLTFDTAFGILLDCRSCSLRLSYTRAAFWNYEVLSIIHGFQHLMARAEAIHRVLFLGGFWNWLEFFPKLISGLSHLFRCCSSCLIQDMGLKCLGFAINARILIHCGSIEEHHMWNSMAVLSSESNSEQRHLSCFDHSLHKMWVPKCKGSANTVWISMLMF